MNMKHTPGPWKLLDFENDERYEVTTMESTKGFYRSVATVSYGYSEPADTQQHANAKLIAAAPELLSALENLVFTAQKMWDDAKPLKDTALVTVTHPMIEEARAAIAKATA